MPNGRKNRNFIPSITHEECTLIAIKDIGKVFTTRFQNKFGHKGDFRFKVDYRKLFSTKVDLDLSQLERPFSLDEIKRTVLDLGGNKASGLDGFLLQLFKLYWARSRRTSRGFVRISTLGGPTWKG